MSYLDGRDDYKRHLAWRPLRAAQRREWMKLMVVLGVVGLVGGVAYASRAFGLSYPVQIALMIGIPVVAWAIAHIHAKRRAA